MSAKLVGVGLISSISSSNFSVSSLSFPFFSLILAISASSHSSSIILVVINLIAPRFSCLGTITDFFGNSISEPFTEELIVGESNCNNLKIPLIPPIADKGNFLFLGQCPSKENKALKE